jgi:NAD(P)-dependent dehydrogenase (short-subunit alcohol dehydrogenase family)
MHKAEIVIITGAGGGIGEGVARSFARAGWTVVVAEINRERGQAVADSLASLGGQGRFIETDVSDLASVRAMVELTLSEFGRVDVLVNNAYPTGSGPTSVSSISDERLAGSLTAGFHAVLAAMQAVYPAMAAQRWGRIINMCSLNGVNAHAGTVDYNCAKEAVRTLTRTAAVEWGKDGITCNAICPGAATPAFKARMAEMPEMMAGIQKMIPMGYSGDPEEDIAPVVLFLASEGSRYMTGNTLYVDGGGHINGVPWKP